MKIALIGGGVMGEAIVSRLLFQKVTGSGDIVISDANRQRRELLNGKYGVETLYDNCLAIEGVDIVVMAIKPGDLSRIMREIKASLSQQVVLSIVAGASLDELCRGLEYSSVVRAMPNMPVCIGEGMTVWTAGSEVSEEQKDLSRLILSAVGKEKYVEEEKYLDMATALSGSGPAYIFLVIEALIDAGVHIGLSRDVARELVVQTILGSTHALEQLNRHPAELRNMVTSPGGTTAEALLYLEKGGLRSLFLQAVTAAHDKARCL